MTKNIKIIDIKPCENSLFIKPQRVFYTQNNSKKHWDFVKSHDSVSILLYHNEKKSFLLVKQFRPPLFINQKNNDGFTYELCAGIMDKKLNEIQTIKEEILEECGYKVEEKNIYKIVSCFSNVGISATKQTIFFASINESQKVGCGGGTNDEMIELFFLQRDDAHNFIYNEDKPKSAGLLFAILWFFANENIVNTIN